MVLPQAKLDPDYPTIVLLNNDSGSADRLLGEQLSEAWDVRIVLRLIKRGDRAENMSDRIQYLLSSANPYAFGELDQIYFGFKDEPEVSVPLSQSVVTALRDRAFAPESAFWIVGSKVIIIRLLSMADKHAAYIAALRSLKDKGSHDRAQYPKLLFTIDEEQARTDLSSHIQEETDQEVTAAIARVFFQHGSPDLLANWLSDLSPVARRAACVAAGQQAAEPRFILQITALLNDADASVAEAAEDALLQLRRTQRRDELLGALATETSRNEKWPVIDLAIAVGDAGDKSSVFVIVYVDKVRHGRCLPIANYTRSLALDCQENMGLRSRVDATGLVYNGAMRAL